MKPATRNSVLTAVPVDPPEPGRAAADIPPLQEDVGPETMVRADLDWEAAVTAAPGRGGHLRGREDASERARRLSDDRSRAATCSMSARRAA